MRYPWCKADSNTVTNLQTQNLTSCTEDVCVKAQPIPTIFKHVLLPFVDYSCFMSVIFC